MTLVVVGLDGASFELIDPWIDEGYLPNIRKMKERGVWADLECCLPPVTSPNWKCYSTGKNPGKLGIFWWENIDVRNKRVYYPKERVSQEKEIWDYLGEQGKSVGVMGMPTTYPPKKVNGFMISGGLDSMEDDFTYPKELEKRLKEEFNYRVRESADIHLNKDKAVDEILELIDIQFNAAETLLKEYKPDFFQITIFAINVLQHFLWDSDQTKKGWQIIDRHLGFLIENGHTVIIMSDHGSNKIEYVFNINTWLIQRKYLITKSTLPILLGKLGLKQEKLAKIATTMKLSKVIRATTSKEFREGIPTKTGEIKHEGKTGIIDWERSTSVASGQGPVYILNAEGENYDSFRSKLKGELEAITTPNGKKIIDKVYRKEDIYSGKYLSEAPDLIIDQAKAVHIPGGIGKRGVFDFSEKWVAENKKYGLFTACGPEITNKGKMEDIRILDLAPTILYIMQVSLSRDMDGRVLSEILKDSVLDQIGKIRYVDGTENEKIQIKEALKGLNI